MATGRRTGSKNRNYPPMRLREALTMAQKIQDEASGLPVSRLTLASILEVSPQSSNFNQLVAASRFYGLTTGGINAAEYALTPIGEDATGGDEVARSQAYRKAVLSVEPFRTFLEGFKDKKVPGVPAFRDFLVKNAGVDQNRATECMEHILADAETAGFLRTMVGGNYIDFAADPIATGDEVEIAEEGAALDGASGIKVDTLVGPEGSADRRTPTPATADVSPKKVFIAHGKNRTPLEQLKKALDTFKVQYAVAVDEPNKGRPISKKVANLMRDDCSSGIFIFTADERFLREKAGEPGETEEVWRPSENVVFELGAASILYENRIVIFKESDVEFPSDFSDLGFIEFQKDQLGGELGALFGELVALDILEVRAKG